MRQPAPDWMSTTIYGTLQEHPATAPLSTRELHALTASLVADIERESAAQMEQVRAAMEIRAIDVSSWIHSPDGQAAIAQQIMDGAATLRGEPVPERVPTRAPCSGWLHLKEGVTEPPLDVEYGAWSCSLCFEPAARHQGRLVLKSDQPDPTKAGVGTWEPRPWHPGELEAKYQAWNRDPAADRAVTHAAG